VDLAITWAENSATHICLQSSTKLGGNDRENYTGTVIKHEIINLSLSSKKTPHKWDSLHQGKCKGYPGPGTHTADVLRVFV
jgi:hypothetical protein